MGNYYEDESACEKWIYILSKTAGKKRKAHLEELCRFKTKAADKFWSARIKDERYLPYIMMCRSEEFSDYTAERFSEFIDRALNGSMDYEEMVNEAYFLLNTCMYKESDKMIGVYRKIAQNSSALRALKISWYDDGTISPVKQPDFLYRRYLLEIENNCESDFFSLLTDTLIMTMVNAVQIDGEYETFTAKVKALYEEFPDIYASAGFYAYFTSDTSEAYDKFEEYTHDPLKYPVLMWVLDGFEFEKGKYIQGSPTVFLGADNKRTHYSVPISEIDFRWYSFFTEKCLRDAENSSVNDPYFIGCFCRKFSGQVLHLINHDDERVMDACRKYFRRSAVIAGNPEDFAGLLECGEINTAEELDELVLDIARRIAEGRQTYCFHILFYFFKSFDHSVKLAAVEKAAEYLAEHDDSERLSEERAAFFTHAERMRRGEKNVFDK